ncbi:hypothetical protein ACN47E_005465 [Coniothyrium glycines]
MSLGRTLASRSLHLRIVPRPANLSESREIFRVLQRFGEISTYKYLRYEYQNPADNVALAIYRDAHSAQQALDASPIRFALEKTVKTPESSTDRDPTIEDEEGLARSTVASSTKSGIDEILRPSQLLNRGLPPTFQESAPKPETPPMPFDPPSTHANEGQKPWTKWFQITVDRSRVVHQDFIERQPYWKQFTPTRSMAQTDLAKQVPHIGLSDVSKRPPNAHRTPVRVLREMNHYVQNRMPTLKGMVQDSESEVEFRRRKSANMKG